MGTLTIQKHDGRGRTGQEAHSCIVSEPCGSYVALRDAVLLGKVHYNRGHKVMLDRDLAVRLGLPVKRIKEQVPCDRERRPEVFLFARTLEAAVASRSQNASSEHPRISSVARTSSAPQPS